MECQSARVTLPAPSAGLVSSGPVCHSGNAYVARVCRVSAGVLCRIVWGSIPGDAAIPMPILDVASFHKSASSGIRHIAGGVSPDQSPGVVDKRKYSSGRNVPTSVSASHGQQTDIELEVAKTMRLPSAAARLRRILTVLILGAGAWKCDAFIPTAILSPMPVFRLCCRHCWTVDLLIGRLTTGHVIARRRRMPPVSRIESDALSRDIRSVNRSPTPIAPKCRRVWQWRSGCPRT